MATGDIVTHLQDVYGSSVSKDLVSRVTDAVLEAMQSWQARRPARSTASTQRSWCEPGGLHLRQDPPGAGVEPADLRGDGGSVDGERDVLGLWAGPAGAGEGARAWMGMLGELKNRGVSDVLIACCDGLKGLPEAITAVRPLATVQPCVVHLVRNSLRYAGKQHWPRISADLKKVHTAPTAGRGRHRVRGLRHHLAAQAPGHGGDV